MGRIIATDEGLRQIMTERQNILLMGGSPSIRLEVARRVSALMPRLTDSEAEELRKAMEIAGIEVSNRDLQRPTPHSSISAEGLCGSESSSVPGEVSLAHTGVLFVNEFQDFRRKTLRALRRAIESSTARVNANGCSMRLAARFLLVAGTNLPVGHVQRDWASTIAGLRLSVRLVPPQ